MASEARGARPGAVRRHAPALSDARQPLSAAAAHHEHPARRASVLRHPRGVVHDGAGDRDRDRRRTADGPHHLRQMAAPGQRLHQRHQRWHSRAFAAAVAVLPGQPRLDHVEVRAASQRPSHLEPDQLRRQRGRLPGAGDGHGAEHPVGQRARADDHHLGARLGDRLARRPGAHLGDVRRVVPVVLVGHAA